MIRISRALWRQTIKEVNTQEYSVNSSIYAIPVYEKFGFEKNGQELEVNGIRYQPMKLMSLPEVGLHFHDETPSN